MFIVRNRRRKRRKRGHEATVTLRSVLTPELSRRVQTLCHGISREPGYQDPTVASWVGVSRGPDPRSSASTQRLASPRPRRQLSSFSAALDLGSVASCVMNFRRSRKTSPRVFRAILRPHSHAIVFEPGVSRCRAWSCVFCARQPARPAAASGHQRSLSFRACAAISPALIG